MERMGQTGSPEIPDQLESRALLEILARKVMPVPPVSIRLLSRYRSLAVARCVFMVASKLNPVLTLTAMAFSILMRLPRPHMFAMVRVSFLRLISVLRDSKSIVVARGDISVIRFAILLAHLMDFVLVKVVGPFRPFVSLVSELVVRATSAMAIRFAILPESPALRAIAKP